MARRWISNAGALAVACGLLCAQTGQYPPGQYPPGQYPPGQYPTTTPGGISLPKINWPKRKPKTEEEEKKGGKKKAGEMPSMDARLRKLGEKEMLVETRSGKVLRFRLLAKTKFENSKGEAVRDSLIKPGDRIEVRVNPDDVETAVVVVLLGAGSDEERAAGAQPVDGGKAGVPVEADFGGVGEAVTAAGNRDQTNLSMKEADEEVLQNARHAASIFANGLPDFLVDQVTVRSKGMGGAWIPADTVTAEVAYTGGQEQYRSVKINGKAAEGGIEKTGAWSTGEFVTTILDLLSPNTDASFKRGGDERVAGRTALVFDFSVTQANTHWRIVAPGGGECMVGYGGRLWVDKASSRVLKVEQRATALPAHCVAASAESVVEYGFVKIAGEEFLMPVRSLATACGRDGGCFRNELKFENYRKFSAASKVSYD